MTRVAQVCTLCTENLTAGEKMEDFADIQDNVDVSSLSDRVFNHIKRAIMTGKLKGGQRIPEQAIAAKFGVSRTPIREALSRLVEQGLVVNAPRRHTKVALVTIEDKKRIGEVRILLSVLAVRLLAEKATPEDCNSLTAIVDKCRNAAEEEDFALCFEMDSLFHCEIAERSGNQYLAELTRILDLKVQLLRNIEDVTVDNVKERISLHVPLIEAICRHDVATAEELTTRHLKSYYFGPNGDGTERAAIAHA
ncbi:MAG: GntR family transcriptional regulator [Spirochaetia bacterium]